MLARTMIRLEREHLLALRDEAHALGISLAKLIRRVVQSHLDGRDAPACVPREVSRGSSQMGVCGEVDVSEDHDRHLAEALRGERAD